MIKAIEILTCVNVFRLGANELKSDSVDQGDPSAASASVKNSPQSPQGGSDAGDAHKASRSIERRWIHYWASDW